MPKMMLSVGLGAATDHNTTSPLRSVALEVYAGPALAAMGAGAGGLIGALYDRATTGSHIIYAASPPRARVTPLLAPGGTGVAVTLDW